MADDQSRRTPADAPLLLDVMLGKLATYLRMCGYDAAYALDRGIEADDALADLADSEGRLLVTRDSELASRAGGLLIKSLDVTDQLHELANAGFALELSDPARCAECNAALVAVAAGAETPEYAPDTDEFRVWRCPDCGQHFWKGSHWESVEETLSEL
ncbi:Mut7-C RNAse domain-containing protein [Halorussus caseinilyticus]|uniref:Mut7-C RNAse domain-containing protein n=1 Tax=Halorussus caseinilyticus TaxID=3034025 RepID=A0ABD5WN65_9EURY|nr:Mut7-C RNAse domain-containing protein [Halorussus sp. DT72]